MLHDNKAWYLHIGCKLFLMVPIVLSLVCETYSLDIWDRWFCFNSRFTFVSVFLEFVLDSTALRQVKWYETEGQIDHSLDTKGWLARLTKSWKHFLEVTLDLRVSLTKTKCRRRAFSRRLLEKGKREERNVIALSLTKTLRHFQLNQLSKVWGNRERSCSTNSELPSHKLGNSNQRGDEPSRLITAIFSIRKEICEVDKMFRHSVK